MIGDDLLGGSFVFDPFELYAAGVVSNPNMVVFGQIGRGKSAFVKTFLWREAVFGRRAWVVDPKGEYGDLAAAWGVRAGGLRPGGASGSTRSIRVPGAQTTHDGGVTGRRRSRAAGFAGVSVPGPEPGSPRAGHARASAGQASRVRRLPPLPVVVGALLSTRRAAHALRTDPRELLEDGRDVALGVAPARARGSAGHVRRPTTPGLDLRPRWSSSFSPPCTRRRPSASSWRAPRRGCRRRSPVLPHGSHQRQTFLVVDEAWAILSKADIH